LSSEPIPTVDEIVSTLKRSFIPTILIEGKDDAFVYRWLKKYIDINPVSLQPCGGRENLFLIHDRRAEFANNNVVFVADKDLYRFDGIPECRGDVIFTSGYCIENDIYDGSTISDFVDDDDRAEHDLLKEIVGKWFAFELSKYMESGGNFSANVSAHINVIAPDGSECICQVFAQRINYCTPSDEVIRRVNDEYGLNVRGKQLFQILSRLLSRAGRFSRFSDKNLIEIALKQENNQHLDRLITEMSDCLARGAT